MAANYWASTQHNYWECSKDELEDARRVERDEGLEKQYPLPDRRFINCFIQQQLGKLGRRMSVRQLVLSTAQVFVCRFYTKVNFRKTNPYLLLTTAFYLACKIEECPHHIRMVVSEARNLWPDSIQADTAKVGECEFYLISELNSQLIVHHPYYSLNSLQEALSMSNDEAALAWSVVNDTYVTDLPFLYPPHVIAVTAVIMALIVRPSHGGVTSQLPARFASQAGTAAGAGNGGSRSSLLQLVQGRSQSLSAWLGQSNVDIPALVDATQILISWYMVSESYDEKICKDAIGRFIKGRGLD